MSLKQISSLSCIGGDECTGGAEMRECLVIESPDEMITDVIRAYSMFTDSVLFGVPASFPSPWHQYLLSVASCWKDSAISHLRDLGQCCCAPQYYTRCTVLAPVVLGVLIGTCAHWMLEFTVWNCCDPVPVVYKDISVKSVSVDQNVTSIIYKTE